MIACKYIGLDGVERHLDLDASIDVVKGRSFRRTGWMSLIVYDPQSERFVDLCDAPPDFRGNSKYVCEEISEADLTSHFSISMREICDIRRNPSGWNILRHSNY